MSDDKDCLYDEVLEFAAQAGSISSSLIQRRFQIGYARAARIIDQLAEDEKIGPADGAKPRKVNVTPKYIHSSALTKTKSHPGTPTEPTQTIDVDHVKNEVIRLGFQSINNVTLDSSQVKRLPKAETIRYLDTGLSILKYNIAPKEPMVDMSWQYLSLDLLKTGTTRAESGDVKKIAMNILSTINDEGYDMTAREVNIGPTVAQYIFRSANGKFPKNTANLAIKLSHTISELGIRIESPIYGTDLLSVEVPNEEPSIVRLGALLGSNELRQRNSNLAIILGRDVIGEILTTDLRTTRHLIITGETGSGKSVMIDSILVNLLFKNSPNELKLILIDPKRCQMGPYQDIPHLITPIIEDTIKTISALRWVTIEAERRLKLLAENSSRNIDEYNSSQQSMHMPSIVVAIDELADVMMTDPEVTQRLILQICQLSRATGIHLILATSRPSPQILTEGIMDNIGSRICFMTASAQDSINVLGQPDAEKLLGNGDMLCKEIIDGSHQLNRVQGAFISPQEVKRVTNVLRKRWKPDYIEEIMTNQTSNVEPSGWMWNDDLYVKARQCVIKNQQASSSLLQRNLRIGYARAARLIDALEENGIISPADGAKPRTVLTDSLNDNTPDE